MAGSTGSAGSPGSAASPCSGSRSFAGVVGFWLVWDQLAQFSAVASMEWLDWLGVFAEPLVRNFLRPESVNDRFFSLLVFLHIGLPLLVLLGLWIHIQRVARPDTRTAPALTWGTLAALVALSLALPVQSMAPADLAIAPRELPVDWFYLAPNVLMYQWSPAALWFAGGRGNAVAGDPAVDAPRQAAAGGSGGPGQLQWLRALLRGLSLHGYHHARAQPGPPGRASRGPQVRSHRRRRWRSLRELRHLRRFLSVIHAFPQHRRARERHRYAAASHRATTQPAQMLHRASEG